MLLLLRCIMFAVSTKNAKFSYERHKLVSVQNYSAMRVHHVLSIVMKIRETYSEH